MAAGSMRLAIPPLILLLGGCANLGYYLHVAGGHADIQARTRPIEEALEDPALAPETRARLGLVRRAREYASRELFLPDNESYRRYADLERPFVVWNVFAAPELALAPREWCFVFAGCVSYRGYFSRARADELAAELRAERYDVYVAGVAAYSTLGWFHDPMLNTILRRPEAEVIGVMFHELAHQKLYVRDDTAFNESFATAVEFEGVKRWYARAGGAPEAFSAYEQNRKRRAEFTALVLKHRARLEKTYGSDLTDAEKRAAKAEAFRALRRDYEKLKQGWNGYVGYDAWFAQDLNNAHLISVGLYHAHVAAFRTLLTHKQGDLEAFYAAAAELARRPKPERTAALSALVNASANIEGNSE